MGTSSATVIFDEDDIPICALYGTYDGDVMGKNLNAFLKDFEIVNGLPINIDGKIANGMNDLAAQIIAHFKTGPGNFYLYAQDCEGDYNYQVKFSDGTAIVKEM